jgi:uncharacterized short protein YbdD (DUF466 family)
VLLRSSPQPGLSCREVSGATVERCLSCARDAAAQLRQGWLRAIGAPDYRAYLAHHVARHPGAPPMTERDFVRMFIERRYNRRDANRCC